MQPEDPQLGPDLRDALVRPLSARHPQVDWQVASAGDGPESYFDLLRVKIHARTPDGQELHLVDLCFTDWTQQLLANRKERLLTSGLGTERLLSAYRAR